MYKQVSWAPGIGIKKSPFKNLFEEDKGVTYIPYARLPDSIQSLAEGGLIDEDSLPQPVPVTGDYLPADLLGCNDFSDTVDYLEVNLTLPRKS